MLFAQTALRVMWAICVNTVVMVILVTCLVKKEQLVKSATVVEIFMKMGLVTVTPSLGTASNVSTIPGMGL